MCAQHSPSWSQRTNCFAGTRMGCHKHRFGTLQSSNRLLLKLVQGERIHESWVGIERIEVVNGQQMRIGPSLARGIVLILGLSLRQLEWIGGTIERLARLLGRLIGECQ